MNILESQLTAAFVISLLHGLIPSHWLPLVALSKQQSWTSAQIIRYSLWAASAHVLGTIIIGLVIFYTAHLSFIGSMSLTNALAVNDVNHIPLDLPFEKLSAIILFILGLVFLYRH